jgi:hypothetical protein
VPKEGTILVKLVYYKETRGFLGKWSCGSLCIQRHNPMDIRDNISMHLLGTGTCLNRPILN